MRVFFSIFTLLYLAGCGSSEEKSPLLRTSLGPTLAKVWDNHGGLQAWRKHGGVSLDYQAVINGKKIHLRSLLLAFRSPASLWKKQTPGDPLERCALDNSASRQDPATSREEHLAKLSVALLFHLPFTLDSGEWVLRQALQAGGDSTNTEFEAARRGGEPEIGPFLLRPVHGETSGGGLAQVHYFCRHPAVEAGIYRVELNEYLSIQGILVATERMHYRLSKEKRPFALPGKGPKPEWTEKLSGIRFLSNEEVDDLLGNNEPRAEEG